MDHTLLAILILIAVALTFDFINGFHDAANSIATVVSTRVLTPGKAVMWAAFFNFIAAVTFGTAVAQTVGAGMVDLRVVTFAVIFAVALCHGHTAATSRPQADASPVARGRRVTSWRQLRPEDLEQR